MLWRLNLSNIYCSSEEACIAIVAWKIWVEDGMVLLNQGRECGLNSLMKVVQVGDKVVFVVVTH
mgnify:CR=1 FL=1